MKNEVRKIKKAIQSIQNTNLWIAYFEDGSISEPLSLNEAPHPADGKFVRIFPNDTVKDVQAKIGGLF